MSTPTPECERTNALLVDLAYGELEVAERAAAERHVPGCQRCKADLESLQGTRRAMQSLELLPAPEGGLESLLAYADQHAARAAAPVRPRWITWAMTLIPVGLAASVGLLIFGHAPAGPSVVDATGSETHGTVTAIEPAPPSAAALPVSTSDVPAPVVPAARDHEAAKEPAAPATAPDDRARSVSALDARTGVDKGRADGFRAAGESAGGGAFAFQGALERKPSANVSPSPVAHHLAANAAMAPAKDAAPLPVGAAAGLSVLGSASAGPAMNALGHAGPGASSKADLAEDQLSKQKVAPSDDSLRQRSWAGGDRGASGQTTAPQPTTTLAQDAPTDRKVASVAVSSKKEAPPRELQVDAPKNATAAVATTTPPAAAAPPSAPAAAPAPLRMAEEKERASTDAVGSGAAPSAQALFQQAHEQDQAGDRHQAIRTLSLLVQQFPGSALAPQACSEAAAWARASGDEVLAEQLEAQLISQYPRSPYAARAQPQRRNLPASGVAAPKAAAKPAPKADFDEAEEVR